MKCSPLVSLVALAVLSSCTSAHDAAVSTFRVLDAPHAYVRRQLGMDENDQPITTTTTTTETTYVTNPPGGPGPQPPPSQPYTTQPPPMNPAPPSQTQTRVTSRSPEREPQPPAENAAEPPPKKVAEKNRATNTRTSEPNPSATPRVASTQRTNNEELPYAKPVPGKTGYVFSPYDKNGGYVDVTGYSPGQKVKDPYTGKIFLVP
jgi:outer membrane biosynthesis protein TonB